jgi:hypothetical protein
VIVHYADKIVNFILVQKTLRGDVEAPPSRVALLVDPLLLFLGLLRRCFLSCLLGGCHLLILPFRWFAVILHYLHST